MMKSHDTKYKEDTMQDMTQQASEIWTCTGVYDEHITFNVLNEETQHVHEERRTREGFALLFALGGYPVVMASMMILHGAGFRFRKIWNGRIYIDGPSIGDDSYHPIDPAPPASAASPRRTGDGETDKGE